MLAVMPTSHAHLKALAAGRQIADPAPNSRASLNACSYTLDATNPISAPRSYPEPQG